MANSHSVAARDRILKFGLSAACCRKVLIFMNKGKFTIKRIAVLGVLTAITVLLAIYATFRVGNQIKIPLKFITIFITGALYGPLSAGLVAAAADLLNAFLVPVGPPLIQITLIEFLYGVLFGFFFKKAKNNNLYYLRALLCSLFQLLIGLFLTTFVLLRVGYFASFTSAIIIRLPALMLTFVIHMAVLCVLKKFIFRVRDLIKNEKF